MNPIFLRVSARFPMSRSVAPSHPPTRGALGAPQRPQRAPATARTYYTKQRKHGDPELHQFLSSNQIEGDSKTLSAIVKTRDSTQEHLTHLTAKERFQVLRTKNHIPEVPNPPGAEALATHYEETTEKFLLDPAGSSSDIIRKERGVALSNLLPEAMQKVLAQKFAHLGKRHAFAREEYSDVYNPEKTPDQVQADNVARRKRQNDFLSELHQIIQGRKPSENKKVVEELKDFIYKREGGIERLNDSELRAVTVALWNHQGHSEIVELFFATDNQIFLAEPTNVVLFAQSALKSPEYFNPFIAIEVANLLLKIKKTDENAYMLLGIAHALRNDTAAKVLQGLKDNTLTRPDIKDYVRAFPADVDISENSIKANYEDTLSSTIFYYDKAFQENFDPRLGLRLLHKYLQAKDFDAAKNTAQVIQLACLREGVPFVENFSIVRAFLEASYVSPHFYQDLVPKVEDQLLALCRTKKETDNALYNLMDLKEICPSAHRIVHIIDKLKEHKEALLQAKTYQEIQAINKANKEQAAKTPLPSYMSPQKIWWYEQTYNYHGLSSNYVTGSLLAAGGQIPSHLVNNYDQQFFRELLHIPVGILLGEMPPDITIEPQRTLEYIEDPILALKIIDRFLRTQYNTDRDQLEDLNSEGHAKYDETAVAAIKLAGVDPTKQKAALKKAPHERRDVEVIVDNTNLSMHLLSRLGDCRLHAQCKQMLFDTWQKRQINVELFMIHFGLRSGLNDTYENGLRGFEKKTQTALRIWDMEVGVEPDGTPKSWDKIESHVTNVLLQMNQGNLEEVTICDSFYQNRYPLASFPLPFQERDPWKDHYPTQVLVEHKGEKREVVLKSSSRAGPKEQYVKGDNQNYFVGLPERRYRAREMVDNRSLIDKRNGEILEWSRKSRTPAGIPPP